ncbi:alpha/beta fold hydrolase [Nonomuraea angiospora]|uniref:alpha/beta fold hydrolase n=1 Tax=Nonomuraea angiospora TaxID=46172 RepID=UPI0036A7D8D4
MRRSATSRSTGTNSGGSSTSKSERGTVPTAAAVFPTDFSVRPLADRVHNVVRWTEFGRGGHFAALETPDLLVTDLREFFRGLR